MACTIWNHKKRPLRYHMGMCNSMPLPYLDEDGGTTATRRLSWCFMLKYAFHWWTGQRIHNNLIVVERYLWLMQDKMIQNLVELRLELFYPPYVAGIDLPHQDVVDSYNLTLLPEPMPYCYLNPCEQISVKFEIRCKFFFARKCTWKQSTNICVCLHNNLLPGQLKSVDFWWCSKCISSISSRTETCKYT